MLPITDLKNNTELLTNIKGLRRKRRVNGEKILEFFVIPDKSNEHCYGMVDTESIVEFDGEEYIIKQANEKGVGKKTIKQVSAVHRFFDDMINAFQYKQRSGLMTFITACNFVFEETDYIFNIIDPFSAQSFENFGRDNCLSLFKTILERYGAEFYVVGNQVNIKRKIGVNGDFQYRYAHNVKVIDKEISTRNLATIIKGFGGEPNESGVYPIQEEYISPNVAVFGAKHATAVYDERIKTVEGMQVRLQRELIDEPQLSITVDLVDLRASGYNYHTASEGDYGFVIYEPMNVDVEARIVEIDEEYDTNLNPLKTAVTLSNIRRNITDVMTRFSRTSKTVERLLQGNTKLPYNVLDDAVKLATEALQSAQTELEFNNGIIARDKNNPNLLVLFNSKGLGISTNGGATFENAFTAYGLTANVITGGQINANNVSIYGGSLDNYTKISGAYVESRGNYTRTWFGEQKNHDISFRLEGGYFKAENIQEDKRLYFSDFGISTFLRGYDEENETAEHHGSGVIEFFSHMYSPTVRGLTLFSNRGTIGLKTMTRDIILDAERHINIMANSGLVTVNGTVFRSSVIGVAEPNTNLYLGVSGERDGEVRVTNKLFRNDGNPNYYPIRASEYRNGSSIEYKTNIEPLETSGLFIVNKLQVKQYHLQSDVDAGNYHNKQVGLISELSPEVATHDLKAINLYKLLSYAVKAIQELTERVESIEGINE